LTKPHYGNQTFTAKTQRRKGAKERKMTCVEKADKKWIAATPQTFDWVAAHGKPYTL
jgi:hypothetical protein